MKLRLAAVSLSLAVLAPASFAQDATPKNATAVQPSKAAPAAPKAKPATVPAAKAAAVEAGRVVPGKAEAIGTKPGSGGADSGCHHAMKGSDA